MINAIYTEMMICVNYSTKTVNVMFTALKL